MLLTAIVILIIVIIILAIRYFTVANRTLNAEEFKREAEKAARDSVRKTKTEITCDYCGTKIDVTVNKTCPSCGASYGADKEWIEKFTPDKDVLEDSAKAYIRKRKLAVRRNTEGVRDTLKKAIITLCVLLGIVIALVIIVNLHEKEEKYKSYGELNEYSMDHFEEVGYPMENNVIIDREGVLVTLEHLYKDAEHNRYKAQYHVVNHTGENISISFLCAGANGYYSDLCGYYFSEDFKKNADVYVYNELGLNDIEIPELDELKSIAFSRLWVRTAKEVMLIDDDAMHTVTTASSYTPKLPVPTGRTVYDDNELLIIHDCTYAPVYETVMYHSVWLCNFSDAAYTVSCSGQINGAETQIHSPYYLTIPGRSIMHAEISGHNASYANASEEDVLLLNLDFRCEKSPEKNFSTGYLEFPMKENKFHERTQRSIAG